MDQHPWAASNWAKGPGKGLIVALLVGLVVRLAFLVSVDTQPVTDFDWYYERAVSIASGQGYSVSGAPTAYWPVGYPAFLSIAFRLFGESVLVGKVLNTLLSLASIALTWALGRRLFGDTRVATGAALVLAVHPAYVAYSAILASEPLYTTLSLAGLLAGIRWPAGFAYGLATLVRPQAIVLPLLATLAEWRAGTNHKRAAAGLAIVLGVSIMVLTPWTVRNIRVFGQFVFVSTNGGDNLWIGNNPNATGAYQAPAVPGSDGPGMSEVERDQHAARSAKAYVRANWGETVSRWPAKLRATFLTGTDAPYWAFQLSKGRLGVPGSGDDKALYKAFRAYSVALVPLVFWLGLGGMALAIFKRRCPLLGPLMVGYTGLLAIVFFGNPRFAFAVVPFLALHAVHGLLLVVESNRPAQPVTAESQSS